MHDPRQPNMREALTARFVRPVGISTDRPRGRAHDDGGGGRLYGCGARGSSCDPGLRARMSGSRRQTVKGELLAAVGRTTCGPTCWQRGCDQLLGELVPPCRGRGSGLARRPISPEGQRGEPSSASTCATRPMRRRRFAEDCRTLYPSVIDPSVEAVHSGSATCSPTPFPPRSSSTGRAASRRWYGAAVVQVRTFEPVVAELAAEAP